MTDSQVITKVNKIVFRLPTLYIIEEPKHYVDKLNALSFALATPLKFLQMMLEIVSAVSDSH
jgi:hypothetical protein